MQKHNSRNRPRGCTRGRPAPRKHYLALHLTFFLEPFLRLKAAPGTESVIRKATRSADLGIHMYQGR